MGGGWLPPPLPPLYSMYSYTHLLLYFIVHTVRRGKYSAQQFRQYFANRHLWQIVEIFSPLNIKIKAVRWYQQFRLVKVKTGNMGNIWTIGGIISWVIMCQKYDFSTISSRSKLTYYACKSPNTIKSLRILTKITCRNWTLAIYFRNFYSFLNWPFICC